MRCLLIGNNSRAQRFIVAGLISFAIVDLFFNVIYWNIAMRQLCSIFSDFFIIVNVAVIVSQVKSH